MPTIADNLGNLHIKGVCKAHMPNNTLFKKGERSHTFRAIDNLIRYHEVSRSNLLLQTTHSTERNHSPDPNASQRRNICPGRYFVRGVLVGCAVAGEEGNGDVVVLQDVDRRGRVAPGSEGVNCCDWDVAFELLQAGAADYCNVDKS